MAISEDDRRLFIFQMTTGARIVDLESSGYRWSTRLNKAGTLDVDIPAGATDVDHTMIRALTTPKKYGIALAVGDTILEAGHITGRNYTNGGATLSLTAVGLWTYLEWVKVFSAGFNRDTGNPLTDKVTISGTTPAGIARQLLRNAAAAPGVAGKFPPILTIDDGETGTYSQTYEGKDLASIGKRLTELTTGQNGPDQGFIPEFTDSTRQAIRWRHVAGTVANPLLMQAGDPHVFDTTVLRGEVTSLEVDEDGSTIATRIWTKGTGDNQGTATGSNTLLIADGYPLLEMDQGVDGPTQAALTASTDAALLESSTTTSTWTMNVKLAPTTLKPGHFAQVFTKDHKGIEDGRHLVRVVGLDGDGTENIKVTILPMLTDWEHFDASKVQRHYLEPDPVRADQDHKNRLNQQLAELGSFTMPSGINPGAGDRESKYWGDLLTGDKDAKNISIAANRGGAYNLNAAFPSIDFNGGDGALNFNGGDGKIGWKDSGGTADRAAISFHDGILNIDAEDYAQFNTDIRTNYGVIAGSVTLAPGGGLYFTPRINGADVRTRAMGWDGPGGPFTIDPDMVVFKGRFIQAKGIYDQTTTAASNVYVDGSGYLSRSTSAARYKLDQQPSEETERILDVQPRNWFDRGAVERNGESTDGLRRVPGLIAEEVRAAGLDEYVIYSDDGQVEGVMYDRVWTELIPVVRKQRDRIAELEERLAKIEERLAA